jgi:serine protease Do
MKISSSKVLGAVGALFVVAAIVTWCVAAPLAQVVRAPRDSHIELFGGSSIGVSVSDVDQAVATRQKLASSNGAVVSEVRSSSPAAKAGLKVEDVIVSFDGETVRSARQFSRLVDETPDGREVPLTVVRDGARVNLKVTPESPDNSASNLFSFSGNSPLRQFQFAMPNSQGWTVMGQPFFADRMDSGDRNPRLGVEVQELTGQLGDFFGTKDGVLVTSVLDGTPAKTAGLKAGDVITRINGRAVLSADDLRRRITGVAGDVTITFYRDRKEQAATVKLDAGERREIIK